MDEWVEEGRKCVPGSAKTICAKTQRQVSRPVRGQREKREGGEEGTGGWARPPQRWVCTLRSPALGRATGRSSTQGVVVKCDAFHPPFSQQHTHGIWNGCLPCAVSGSEDGGPVLWVSAGALGSSGAGGRDADTSASSAAPPSGPKPGLQAGQDCAFLFAPSSSVGTAALPSRFLPDGS